MRVVARVGITPIPLRCHLEIFTSIGELLWPSQMLKECIFSIKDQVIKADSILLDLHGLDEILSMDWLVANHASMDCYKKEMIFGRPGLPVVVFHRKYRRPSSGLIFSITMRHLLRKVGEGYLAQVIYTWVNKISLEDVLIVKDFPDVFPEELSVLPLEREIDFAIDLVLSTIPISSPTYRMTPTELRN